MESIIGDWREFLHQVVTKCEANQLSLIGKEIDHICYRCENKEEYVSVRDRLILNGSYLILESMVGGRPISVFELSPPLEYEGWQVRCLELACPKPGRSHSHGLEHAEVVIGKGISAAFNSRELLENFVKSRNNSAASTSSNSDDDSTLKPIQFDFKAIDKPFNADVCVDLGDGINVKFHAAPLYDVCAHEVEGGMYDPVPANYFLQSS